MLVLQEEGLDSENVDLISSRKVGLKNSVTYSRDSCLCAPRLSAICYQQTEFSDHALDVCFRHDLVEHRTYYA